VWQRLEGVVLTTGRRIDHHSEHLANVATDVDGAPVRRQDTPDDLVGNAVVDGVQELVRPERHGRVQASPKCAARSFEGGASKEAP
jgi:hypothetical protein